MDYNTASTNNTLNNWQHSKSKQTITEHLYVMSVKKSLTVLAHSTIQQVMWSMLTHSNIGTNFHRAMVATALGGKLLIGRRAVRNWIQQQYQACFLHRKLHLFLGKSTKCCRYWSFDVTWHNTSTKTAATRAVLFDSSIHKIVCWLRLRPRPHQESLQCSPRPL